ncbi:DUF922 domain-containing protein [Runella sp.]|uniref:DUF922 domain-containing protein n=1 Tax=Runella sp. TaxID=1960881 RepID=UPI003D0FCC1B
MQRSVLWLLLFFVVQYISPTLCFSQTQTIALKPERLKVQPKGFFIIEVIDNRPVTSNIGKIWSRPQPLTAVLQGGTAPAIDNFLRRYFNPSQTDSLTPIILVIKELQVTEALIPPAKVSGTIRMNLGFETYREGKRTFLTSANASATYTRAGIAPEDIIEPQLRNLLENELKGFNKWFAQSVNVSDIFARNVTLILESDSLPPPSKADTLVYYNPKRPLIWQDFQGAPTVFNRWAAQVFTSFGFEARSAVKNRTLELRVKTKVWIDKTISWVRPDSKNDYVLDHEQLHFDVTRLTAERFRRKLQSMTFSVEDFSSEIQYQYLEFYRLHSQLQQQYDDETNHGINQGMQAAWAKKVRDELRSYGVLPSVK